MLEMIAATTSLLLATSAVPAIAPVAVLPVMVASTAQATTLAAVAHDQSASAEKVSPVDAVLEVSLSRGKFVTRHENGKVEYHPRPATRMKLALVGDESTVCDFAGQRLQASDNGRCVLDIRSSDVSGKLAARHIVGNVYEVQYAGTTLSGELRPREAFSFDMDGINVGVMLYPLSEVASGERKALGAH